MRFLILFLAILVLLILQSGLFAPLGLANFGNLLLVFVVISILYLPAQESLFVIIISGLFLDFLSSSVDGTNMLALLGTYFFTRYLLRLMPKDKNFVLFTTVSLNTILFSLSFVIIGFVTGLIRHTSVDWKYFLTWKLIGDLIINALFAYPIFWLHKALWIHSKEII